MAALAILLVLTLGMMTGADGVPGGEGLNADLSNVSPRISSL